MTKKQSAHFFTNAQLKSLDFSHLPESCLDLSERGIKINSTKLILFKQTCKDAETTYRDNAGFDLSYDEFKDFCRKTWKDEEYK